MLPSEDALAPPPRIHARRRWRSALAFPLLILVIVTGFYWKLTLTRQFDWIWGPDLVLQVLPWLDEEARQVHHFQLPLWDPHQWLGAPILGQAQPGGAYPLNWLLFLVPESGGHIDILALQWYFVAIHFMAALFCYLLCRDLGCSRTAALAGGLVFSLAGYVGTTDWPQMVNGAVWLPLVLLFLLRAVRGPLRGLRPYSNAALAGVCLGMAWLSGHHQVPIFTVLTATGVWLYYILRDGRIHWPLARVAALMAVFMLLVGALQILPAEEYGHLAHRWVSAEQPLKWDQPVPYAVHSTFSLSPISLFAIVFPGLARHADPFIGVVALALVLLAIALAWNRHAVKLFAAVALAGLVYSLGRNSVFQGILYGIVPVLDKARVPSMAVVIFNVGAAVLAAFGVDHFETGRNSLWARRIVTGLLGFGLLTFTLVMGALCMKQLGWDTDDRVVLTGLIGLLLAALLYAWRSGNLTGSQPTVLLIMLLLLELGNNSGYAFVDRSDPARRAPLAEVTGDADLAEFLKRQPAPFRIDIAGKTPPPSWAAYHDFDVVYSVGASIANNIVDNTEWHTWQNRYLFGVRYTLGEKPPFADSVALFESAHGLKVFQNPSAFPRAWAVHEIIPIHKPSEGMEIVSSRIDDLRHKAFSMEKIPALSACAIPDDVSVPSYLPEQVVIQANMACQGMVILSDTFFPGWQARVDGARAQIFEVDGALRGVVVPQGAHRIVMRYRPAPVYWGAALTLLGWAGAAILILAARRQERIAS